MKRANLKILTVVLMVFATAENIKSQDTLISINSSSRLLIENQWLNTNNIAGTIFSPFLPDGEFVLGFTSKKGDYKYSQKSPKEQIYSFNSGKSLRINKAVFNGSIGYKNMQQEDVGWNSRMDPITHNPYMIMDTLYGLYIKDYIYLEGGLGYEISERFSTGIQIDYSVADGARIKDPRPKNACYTLKAYPSFIYSFNKFKLGLNLFIHMGRERINYSTLETSTTYKFYRTFGLGKTPRTINSWSYRRNYYSSGMGGNLQIQYNIGDLEVLSGLGYTSQLEESEDGTSKPQKSDTGDFEEKSYDFFTAINYKKNLLHSVSLSIDILMGKGIEYIQEAYLLDGVTYWRTIAEVSNYSITEMIPSINYILAKPYNSHSNKWEIIFDAKMDIFSSEYFLEAEESYTNLLSNLGFKKTFFFKKDFLSALLSGTLSYNIDNNLNQLSPYTAEQEIDVWNHVIEPDFLITTSNVYSLNANFRYGRMFKMTDTKKNLIYIDFGTNFYFASNDQWTENKTFEQYYFKLGFTY